MHTVRSVLPVLLLLPLGLLPLGGCVGYEAADVALDELGATLPTPPVGPLSFDAAVAFALDHNPELQALAAEARAAGADVPPTMLEGQWDGHEERLAVMLDPIALLRFGERGAAVDLAAARGDEAMAALAVARWRLVGRIAEVYAALAALETVPVPTVAVDPEPFVRAGLASPLGAAQLRAAAGGAAAEATAHGADRAALLADLCRLLGLPAGAALTAATGAPGLPDVAASEEALLRRPDLALALAQYRVADAAFRSAVRAQYPSIAIGPDLPLSSGGGVDVMTFVKLPLFADGPAAAAKERRTAARARLVEAFVAASAEAHVAASQHRASAQRADAAAAGAEASAMALTAATTALATEVDAFGPVAGSAAEAVRMASEHRLAAVAAARARVQHAVAWGWPLPASPQPEVER